MAWRYSALVHGEVWVDEHLEREEICAECGEMTWEPRWDDDPFCEDCYEELFGL